MVNDRRLHGNESVIHDNETLIGQYIQYILYTFLNIIIVSKFH